jgi:hypothetical protein
VVICSLLFLSGCDKDRDKQPEKKEPAPAKPEAPKASSFKEPEWRRIFDGKTMDGWKATDFFGGQAKVRVENGAIILPAGNDMTGVTYDRKDYLKINYEIELDAQRVEGSDFFCGLTFPVKDSSASLILGGWGGSVCGISSLNGEDAANNETTKTVEFKNGQWYKVRVRVTEEKIEAFLDDEQIVDCTIGERRVSVRLEVENSQPLGIATWRTTGAARDIRIRKLWEDK